VGRMHNRKGILRTRQVQEAVGGRKRLPAESISSSRGMFFGLLAHFRQAGKATQAHVSFLLFFNSCGRDLCSFHSLLPSPSVVFRFVFFVFLLLLVEERLRND